MQALHHARSCTAARICSTRCTSSFRVARIAPVRPTAHPRASSKCRATPEASKPEEVSKAEEEFEGLLPEEDYEVPGTYMDALNPQTKLGKAVKGAVKELEQLNSMEMETLTQAEALLKKMGMKGSLFGAAGQPTEMPTAEEIVAAAEAADDDEEDGSSKASSS